MPRLPSTSIKSQRQQYYRKAQLSNPSEIAKPAKIKGLQSQDPPFIRCNRPDTAEAEIPVTLLFRGFAQFVDDCKLIDPEEIDLEIALELSHKMCQFYPGQTGEAERMHAFRKTFNRQGIQMNAAAVGSTRSATDFDIRHNLFVICTGEGKVEIGQGGGEPLIQATVYYAALVKEVAELYPGSPLPSMLLYVYGAFNDTSQITYSTFDRRTYRFRWCCLHRPPKCGATGSPTCSLLPFDQL
jgi:hypothetical protein